MPTPDSPVDYQRLFRSLPNNLLLMEPDGTILDNTDSHVAVSMKTREEAVGRSLFDAYPSVDQNQGDIIAASHEHVRRHLEPHSMPIIRYDLARPAELGGGLEEMYWQATHYPIFDEQGQLQYILQRTQNVTEQYLATLEADKAQQALADAQDRTRFVLENLPVSIWTAQPNGERDYFNTRWLAFTGRTLEEQLGGQWMTSLHPEDRDRVLNTWQESIATGNLYQVEYRLRRHDGQYRWILVRATPAATPRAKSPCGWAAPSRFTSSARWCRSCSKPTSSRAPCRSRPTTCTTRPKTSARPSSTCLCRPRP
ncbi:PAS domain-containing protein [Hymenobacter humi]|uniref:histidine kinase n=1 Tax=Hymenobacter humi TaxID=1411620 RepID=A0ABW2U4D4_9BACT